MAASNQGSNVATKAGEREIVATRVFDAPRELVFKLWTEPKHVAQWWGPKGFTNTIYEMDVRPGGVWRFVMHGPDGVDYENKIVYKEIVKPERLVYSHVSGPQFHVTVTFADQGDKTKLTVRMLFESATQRERVIKEFGAIEGLNQTLERLEEQLAMAAKNRSAATFTMPSDREIVSTRVFDAPRRLVFEAWTKSEHVKRWYGPRAFTVTVCEIDLRPGGAYRYVLRGPDGNDYAFSGAYREIVPPARLAYTWGWEAMPGHEALETVTFDEHDGKTKLTMKTLFQTVEDLDGWAKSGGREGMAESLDRLAEHLDAMAMSGDGAGNAACHEGFRLAVHAAAEPAERVLVITRVFDAPRELVFKAWTEPERLMRWWGPKGFTTPFCKVDLRPGGVFHYCMRSPEGRGVWGKGVYREIVKPERIVYTDTFADEEGNPVEPAHYGMSPGHPRESLVTVTFTEHEGKTKVTLQHAIPESVPERSGIQQGWTEMLDRLAEELAKGTREDAS